MFIGTACTRPCGLKLKPRPFLLNFDLCLSSRIMLVTVSLAVRAAAITGYVYCLCHTVSQHIVSFVLVRAIATDVVT